jgi:ATP-dependent Clp protease ATP-binding subunit ClpA
MISIDKKNITERQKKLDDCKIFLKAEFIGIDDIIDDLVNYLQIWYLIPEILTRPIIINLWGMTGVGKTDLIRKMVKFIDFQDRFSEIELSNIDESSYNKSVSQILQNNEINDEKPAIVLFDEIQRFNTIDQEGKPMPQSKFIDFWELLSDGRLSKKDRYDFDYYLHSFMSRKKENARKKLKGEETVDENPFVNSWDAKSLKTNLGLDKTIEELTDMTEADMIELILQSKKKKKIYEPVNHSKTLIIISGNLDEAFQMANQTSEADVEADIYHAFTKKITFVDIKNALSKKFRPEQVARFGNIHLIYNSLKRSDFEKLISIEINKIIKARKQDLGIDITVSKKIETLIYNNGVFPVQGVRPVFSSIIDILEACLNKFIFTAITTTKHKLSRQLLGIKK